MTQTIVNPNRIILDANAYDSMMDLFVTVQEGPTTSADVLKWNSCLREAKARFEYKFGRA